MSTISTLGQHLRLQARIQATRSELNRLTEEVASGTHADYFEGLGTQSGRGLAMRSAYQQAIFYQDAAAVVASRLEGQQQAIGQVKDIAQAVRDQMLSVQSGSADQNAVRVISDGAAGYLAQMRATLNQTYAGQYLFSGPATATAPVRAPDEANADGNSLQSVIAAIKSGYDLETTEGMQGFLDEVHAVFAGTHPNPAWNFDKLVYAGSITGTMSGIIDSGLEVSTDVRANDPAFKTVLEALSVAAAVPAREASAASYRQLAGVLASRLTEGVSRTLDLAATVGHRQSVVEDTKDRHDRMASLLGAGLSELESIDDYAASTRLSELQTQLETSYAVTARLGRLSLVSYL
ncbi:flagellin [Benzoatithermus flavus]|uniref:Flagellin n=1 Tax=Benzoatithermus flavus TaxID=3108223 RepID=A0ABU8XVJ4_9PROT